MKNQEEHIALLRHMAAVLRERKSHWLLSEFQKMESARGVQALDKAVEALQVQVCA